MYNEITVVKVDYFKAKGNVQTFDTKGKPNVILVPVCGKIPNQAQVIAGSVAMNAGILLSDGSISSPLQMVHITEGKTDPTYGRQFNVSWLSEVSARDLSTHQREMGKGLVETTSVAAVANDPAQAATAAAALSLITSGTPGEEAEPGANDGDAEPGADDELNAGEQPAPPVNKAAAKAVK